MEPEFDKNLQYGMYAEIIISEYPIHWGANFQIVGFDQWCDEAVETAKKWLQRTIDEFIPAEYQNQIEWIIKPPVDNDDPYTNNGTVGWKYTPKKKE